MKSSRFAVILIGPPGSGKTVITEHLASHKRVATLEMGRLLREEVKRETTLGKQLKPFLEAGQLAPLALVSQVVEQALEQIDREIVLFDGFPRDWEQVAPFFQLSRRFGLELTAVVVLELSPDVVLKRLSGRRICPNCGAVFNIYFDPPAQPNICDRCGATLEQRPDDAPEIIQKRLQTYQAETTPVVEYFQTYYPDLTYRVPAEKPVPEVLQAVSAILETAGLVL